MQFDLSRLEDPRRMAALDRTGLLDSPGEPAFDRLTRLAARLLGVPVSLTSLITPTRQFFKSQVGLGPALAEARETPLSYSYCQYVVASERPLVIEDARTHPVVRGSPAIPDLGVLAYLGIPIRAPGGEVLGSFCTLDYHPRKWSEADIEAMREFAAIAESEIELRLLRKDSYLLDGGTNGARGEGPVALPAFLQGALDALTTRIAVLDETGIVLALNEAWHEAVVPAHQSSPSRDLGKNYLDVLARSSDEGALTTGIQQVIRRQVNAFVHQYSLVLDGETRWYEARVSRFRKAGPARVVVAHHDITELKLAERRLGESEEALRQSRRLDAIGRLAGGVAHDFNNLLTAIQGNADILADVVGDGEGEEEVAEIGRAAGRATELTRQLLAFGRNQVLRPALIDPGSVVLQADRMLRRLIGSHIEMSTLLAPGVGRVQVDPGQLEQVLVNLVLNARDAMPDGGRVVIETMEMTLAPGDVKPEDDLGPGTCVALRVRDTGPGIPAAFMDRIFEPFFTSKGPGEGTGLGLATCYGIVRQSGGRISVESTPGQGTTFTVLFPRAADPLPDGVDASAGAVPEIVPERARNGGTVLLVEDEAAVLRLAALGLRSAGFTVLEAANGEEAIRVAGPRAEGVDLLITDVIMPLMGGRELAGRLRARRPDLPVLFISGYTGETASPSGAWGPGLATRVGYLAKPFTLDELTAAAWRTMDPE